MTTMNAMAVHAFGPAENLIPAKLAIRDPAPGELLIRIRAAAVNPADLGMRAGRYAWPEPVRMPVIPGYDLAGVVEQGTEAFPAGTAVIAYTAHSKTQTGAYAEYATLPEHLVAAAPKNIGPAEAAALPLAGLTAQTALYHLDLKPGQTLLVNRAAGAVGGFAAQLARARGIEVLTDPDQRHTVDAALDVVGAKAALAAFARVRDGGRYATVVPEFWLPGGQFTPARDIDPVTVFVDPELADLAELARLTDAGVLTPRVADTLPLASAAEAHRRMERGGAVGKLVLLP
ncbi:NADPH2:quinone reductase [Catenulispora sp. GP43]|uniref:zinc-binding dehydrogenase n=1 Tax=Catenulispora sp. GP43 TaxID=3156263 RepID=UPI003519B238